jgi:hypothetical protein
MRVANFFEGLVYLIGFLLVFMVVFVSRSAQRTPVAQLATVPVRRRTYSPVPRADRR